MLPLDNGLGSQQYLCTQYLFIKKENNIIPESVNGVIDSAEHHCVGLLWYLWKCKSAFARKKDDAVLRQAVIEKAQSWAAIEFGAAGWQCSNLFFFFKQYFLMTLIQWVHVTWLWTGPTVYSITIHNQSSMQFKKLIKFICLEEKRKETDFADVLESWFGTECSFCTTAF